MFFSKRSDSVIALALLLPLESELGLQASFLKECHLHVGVHAQCIREHPLLEKNRQKSEPLAAMESCPSPGDPQAGLGVSRLWTVVMCVT